MSATGDDIPHDGPHDLASASALSGMPAELILELRHFRMTGTGPAEDPSSISFDIHSIYRLRRIENLRQQCRLGPESLRLVVELIERLDAAERELRALRDREF